MLILIEKPLVAIVGRPNVGKSTLFNKLCGRRISIVEDTPGVTRDRLYVDVEWTGHLFTIIDTGGIEPEKDDVIQKHMHAQAQLAIETADVIIFVVDARQGITTVDEDVAKMLRQSKKPIVLAANKAETETLRLNAVEFYSLDLGEPIPISAEQSQSLGDLLDIVVKNFPRNYEEDYDNDVIKIAVVGKPNAGKSSIVNRILKQERSIVSDIAGTTRDAIDTPFTHNGKNYMIIDTAGIRRKSRIEDETIERYSVIRSLGAVRRADVTFIVIDADEGLTEQDVKIAGYAHNEGKPSVIVVNKWDLIEKDTNTMSKFKKKLDSDLVFMNYAPSLFISALTGQRMNKLLELADYVVAKANTRITTGLLNDIVLEAITASEPPTKNGRRLKVLYATQVTTNPPTFVLFVNDTTLVHFSYTRYLENYLRKSFDLDGTPIRIIFRQRDKGDNDVR